LNKKLQIPLGNTTFHFQQRKGLPYIQLFPKPMAFGAPVIIPGGNANFNPLKTRSVKWKYEIRKVYNISAIKKYCIAVDHRQHS